MGEGKEVKAAVFTSSSFASSSFARFTDADGPKLSRLSDVFRLVLKTVIPTTTKTELSFFLFHGLSRSDKLSVSFSASRHCFLLYSKFPTTTSITYMIKKKKLKFRVLFPPKKNYLFGFR